MIVRLVQLPLRRECVEEFQRLFGESHPHLMATPGCTTATLRVDHHDPTVYWTVSEWQSVEDLDSYRSSVWFGKTWPRIKAMLSSKAQAWTLDHPPADTHELPSDSS